MEWLEELWEAIIGALQEYCFDKIKMHVKSKFLRAVLYVLTVVGCFALLLLPVILFFALIRWALEGIVWVLEGIENLLSIFG